MKKQLFTHIGITILLILTIFTFVDAQSTKLKAQARNTVANLYKEAKTKNIAEWDKVKLQKYFDTKLAGAIYKVTHGENGIDFDILYNAQDTKITNFFVSGGYSSIFDGGRYTVIVGFKNFGESKQLYFTLEKDFKISEVKYDGGDYLTKILATN